MNLPISTNQDLTMSSREIAELTGKEHSNVKRDISVMVLQLNYPDLKLKDCPIFDPSELKGHNISIGMYDHCGNVYDEFYLDHDMTLTLVSGYNVSLRLAIIKRWQELELQQSPKLPASFAEALQLAADQAKQLELAAPKVEFHDTVVQSDHTYKFQEAGKKIQQRPNKFVKWLRDNGYLMKNNIPYQQYVDLGVMIVHTGINNEGFEFTQGRITTKGLAYFSKKLEGVKI